jgi:hypothetical protein
MGRKAGIKAVSDWFKQVFGRELNHEHLIVDMPIEEFLTACKAVVVQHKDLVNKVVAHIQSYTKPLEDVVNDLQKETEIKGTGAYKLNPVLISAADAISQKQLDIFRTFQIPFYSPDGGFQKYFFTSDESKVPTSSFGELNAEDVTLTTFWGLNVSEGDEEEGAAAAHADEGEETDDAEE